MNNNKPFFISVFVACIILYAGAMMGVYLSKKEMPLLVWILIPLYALVTFILFKLISSSIQKTPTRFVTSVYTSVLVKLFLSLTIVGVYFFLQLPGKKALALATLVIYTVFTIVLIRSLLPLVRKNDQTQNA